VVALTYIAVAIGVGEVDGAAVVHMGAFLGVVATIAPLGYLHELGHVLAAKAVGYRVLALRFVPWGDSWTEWEPPPGRETRARTLVALAGGPVVTLAVAAGLLAAVPAGGLVGGWRSGLATFAVLWTLDLLVPLGREGIARDGFAMVERLRVGPGSVDPGGRRGAPVIDLLGSPQREPVVGADPWSDGSLAATVRELLADGRPEDALEAASVDRSNAAFLSVRAVCELALCQADAARSTIARALAVHGAAPAMHWYFRGLDVTALAHLGRDADALRALDALVAEADRAAFDEPGAGAVAGDLATLRIFLLLSCHRTDDAERLVESPLVGSSSVESAVGRAMLHQAAGRIDAAIAEIERLRPWDREHFRRLGLHLGDLHLVAGRPAAAAAALGGSPVHQDPNRGTRLARALLQLGDVVGARTLLQEADRRSRSSDTGIVVHLAIADLLAGDAAQATPRFEAVLGAEMRSARPDGDTMALALLGLGQPADASRALELPGRRSPMRRFDPAPFHLLESAGVEGAAGVRTAAECSAPDGRP
jgi:hypothetical protein